MCDLLGKHGLYVTGKFEEAVRILATKRGSINDRLVDAGKVLLEFPEEGLPTVDGVDKDIQWILARFRRGRPYRDQSVVAASIHGIKDGPELAERIFEDWRKLNIHKTEWFARTITELNRGKPPQPRHPKGD